MAENRFKDTLNLPQTDMPMRAGLAQKEPEIIKKWEDQKVYQSRQSKNKQAGNGRFLLHDGPPYPNGDIHLGHALNKTLKDIVVKYHLLKGEDTPYKPGWDCHGLPIETQLLKSLKKKDVGPGETHQFRDQCRDYALKYVDGQKKQFDRLGVFGDFDNPYLTLTPDYEAGVIDLFGKLAEKGLVFQGKKPIHWCYHCKTALAEAEIDYEDETSTSVFVRFPLEKPLSGAKNVSLIVWTTTPWTLPANVAVAVNPAFSYVLVKSGDEHFVLAEDLLEKTMTACDIETYTIVNKIEGKSLEGLIYTHPFFDKSLPVVCADYVSNEDGSGLVHIAPGHGHDDYLVGLDYDLPIVMPVDATGVFTEEAGKYEGMHVVGGNKQIVADLGDSGRLIKMAKIRHSYPHCWRCSNPVIFRATEQWFIAMEDDNKLREKSLKAINDVEWFPDWGIKRITSMVESRPDWCISRQRSWGIPIPVFYCESCETAHYTGDFNKSVVDVVKQEGTNSWFTKEASEILPKGITCTECGKSTFRKDTNIMDVWLESGSSFHSVLTEKNELSSPADLYLEGSDQHRGWFQSSLLTSVGAFGKAPYKQVLTHGFTVDEKGQKMSKSKGNVIDPLKIINASGADILRLWVGSIDFKNDVVLSDAILKQIRDAYSKIRNTIRFMISNLYDIDSTQLDAEPTADFDRWILAKLQILTKDVTACYDRYEFHTVYHKIYNFCVKDLSALYLDVQKDNLYCNEVDSVSRTSCQRTMFRLSETLIGLLAPILSFTSEDIYGYLPGKKLSSIFMTSFPVVDESLLDTALLAKYEELVTIRETINTELEQLRRDKIIGSSLDAKVTVETESTLTKEELESVLVVSEFVLKKGTELKVTVEKAEGEKCERCWKYATLDDGLCPRCHAVVS
jgi:isoleucyl-tRNA synthetase